MPKVICGITEVLFVRLLDVAMMSINYMEVCNYSVKRRSVINDT